MLCDSNILIYAAEPDETRLDPYLEDPGACIASITRIEVLGFPGFDRLDEARQERLWAILVSLVELPLDERIIREAITLRRQRKIKLGDSIIAATALVHGLPLVTRNVEDFRHVAGLRIINPFDSR
jgi:predicted nucleic acid-binding protein